MTFIRLTWVNSEFTKKIHLLRLVDIMPYRVKDRTTKRTCTEN